MTAIGERYLSASIPVIAVTDDPAAEGGLMDERDVLAERFDAERGRLRAVAYRMLGSLTDAEDAVQEAWLRLARSDESAIENLSGWLTTVVGRVCLDMLRARTARREDALDVRLPDPVVTYGDESDPEAEALLANSVGLALLVVLETLTPAERLAFVLHDMFAVPFDEIARMLGRSPDATKMMASRARRRVRRAVPAQDADTPGGRPGQDRRDRRATRGGPGSASHHAGRTPREAGQGPGRTQPGRPRRRHAGNGRPAARPGGTAGRSDVRGVAQLHAMTP